MRRKETTLKTFRNIIDSSLQNNLRETFDKFKRELEIGQLKKDNLVRKLVLANKIKQSESLHIWNTGARVNKQMEKKKVVHEIFGKVNNIISRNFLDILNSKFVYLYLLKYSNNYTKNILSSLRALRQLPPRINWTKKQSILNLSNRLQFLQTKDKTFLYDKFK